MDILSYKHATTRGEHLGVMLQLRTKMYCDLISMVLNGTTYQRNWSNALKADTNQYAE